MANLISRGEPQAVTASIEPKQFNTPRSITASAVPINMKLSKEVDALRERKNSSEWQSEAWDYYDLIGEIKYAANLIANPLSRINLYVGYIEDSANVPSKIKQVEGLDPDLIRDAENVLYALESGNGGTSGVLRAAALNLFIVGEFYLVKEPPRFGQSTGRFQVRSVEEVIANPGSNGKGNTVFLKTRKDAKPNDYIALPRNGYASRMWRNHPRFSDDADSSMRGVLDICDELLLLSRAARASAKSRLNAGILYIPDGISAAKEADTDDEDVESGIDSIEEELIEAILEPVGDDSSGAAVMPTILRGPEEYAQSIRHITIDRPMDVQSTQRSERLLERILAGLDIPLDVAKGLSGVKYSNAILIEEQLYKAHIEPLILMIVDSLTIGFLRYTLTRMGWTEDDVSRIVVWYDPSAITAKPSKSEAATTGFGMGIISGEAWRRYNGFAESDKPSPLESAQRLAESRGALSEPLTDALVKTMIPEDILQSVRQQQLEQSGPDGALLQQALGGPPAPSGGTPQQAVEQKAPPVEIGQEISSNDPEAQTEPTENEDEDEIKKVFKNPVQGAPEDLIDP